MVAGCGIIPPYFEKGALHCEPSILNFKDNEEEILIESQDLVIEAEDVVIKDYKFLLANSPSLILKDEVGLPEDDFTIEYNNDVKDDDIDDVKVEEEALDDGWIDGPLHKEDFDPFDFNPTAEDAKLKKYSPYGKKGQKIRGQAKPSKGVQEARIHKCYDCCLCFDSENSLSMHIQLVHKHFQQFQCSECELNFDLKSKLSRHILNHTTKSLPHKFKCKECDLTFRKKCNLNLHTFAAHFNEKEKCTDGNHSFCQILILRRYDRLFPSQSNLLKCSECNFAFIREHCLAHHVRSVHDKLKLIRNTNVGNPFENPKNNFENPKNNFENPKNNFENKLKLFRCVQCSFIYKDRIGLFTHILTDHQNSSSMFKCSKCNSTFNDDFYLKKHILNTHNKDSSAK